MLDYFWSVKLGMTMKYAMQLTSGKIKTDKSKYVFLCVYKYIFHNAEIIWTLRNILEKLNISDHHNIIHKITRFVGKEAKLQGWIIGTKWAYHRKGGFTSCSPGKIVLTPSWSIWRQVPFQPTYWTSPDLIQYYSSRVKMSNKNWNDRPFWDQHFVQASSFCCHK